MIMPIQVSFDGFSVGLEKKKLHFEIAELYYNAATLYVKQRFFSPHKFVWNDMCNEGTNVYQLSVGGDRIVFLKWDLCALRCHL